MGALVQSGNITYQGSFRLPQGTFGTSSFAYGGYRASYSKDRGTLIIAGHNDEGSLAEVSIPVLKSGAISSLNTASIKQNFRDVIGDIPNDTLADVNGVKIGGIYPYNGKIYGTAFRYYDGDGSAIDSQWIIQGTGLTNSLSGYYPVGPFGGGFYGGWIIEIPSEHTGAFGRPQMVGCCGLAIASRTSWGPAVHGIDITKVGMSPTPSAIPYLYYTETNDINDWYPGDNPNSVYNLTTEVVGAVFPTGTNTVMFFGAHGTGAFCYGSTPSPCPDPDRAGSSTHAPPYFYQIWAYDASDLLKVRSGTTSPWVPFPYGVWRFTLPYDVDSARHPGGVAYDPINNRIFWLQVAHDGSSLEYPIVDVFSIQNLSGSQSSGGGGGVTHTAQFDFGSNVHYGAAGRKIVASTLAESSVRSQTNIFGVANYKSQMNFAAGAGLEVSPVFIGKYSGISKYSVSGIYNYIFRDGTLTKPQAYLGLSNSLISASDTMATISEVVHANAYLRIPVTGSNFWSQYYMINGSGRITNLQEAAFGVAQGDWGTIKSWFIADNSGDGAGNIMFYAPVPDKSIGLADRFKFQTGTIKISIN